MNASVPQPVLWSRGRLWVYFVVVLAVQIILLLALSERKPILPRQSDQAASFYAATVVPADSPIAVLLALGDPTLFAVPHPRGFSGPAWLNATPLQHQSDDWTEPQRWLTQSSSKLGETFEQFLRTNIVTERFLAIKPAGVPEKVPVRPLPVRGRSGYRIEGDLTRRELLAPLNILSVPHTEVLTNTVVQIAVSQSGFVFSPVILVGSGSRIADQHAVELARTARFKRLVNGSPQGSGALTWGRIIFQWHTLEMPATNNVAVRSSP